MELFGLAVPGKALHRFRIPIVEIGVYGAAQKVRHARAQVHVGLEASAAEVDVGQHGQRKVGQRTFVGEGMFFEILFPASLFPSEFGHYAEEFFLGIAEGHGAAGSGVHCLFYRGGERHARHAHAGAATDGNMGFVVRLGAGSHGHAKPEQ